jgi:hypothetical protein
MHTSLAKRRAAKHRGNKLLHRLAYIFPNIAPARAPKPILHVHYNNFNQKTTIINEQTLFEWDNAD